MKKIMIVMMALVFALSLGILSGCGSSSSSDEVKYADEDFIKSMQKGLEARWDLTEKAPEKETIEDMQSYIQAELDQLTPYESATFKDTKLQEKALKYINVLKDSYENASYALSDKEYEKWQAYVDERAVLIKDFVDNYGLTVDKKYQATLDEFLANGEAVNTKSEQEETIKALVDKLDFEVVEEDYGWKTYEATLENTTDYEIVDLSLDINLLDGDGVIITTEYASASNVAKGQKAKLSFETDENFEKIEKTISWFEVK